jgi:hypothetical protein
VDVIFTYYHRSRISELWHILKESLGMVSVYHNFVMYAGYKIVHIVIITAVIIICSSIKHSRGAPVLPTWWVRTPICWKSKQLLSTIFYNHFHWFFQTTLRVKSSNLWAITPCGLLKVNRRFGGACRIHLPGRKISQARNQCESRWRVGTYVDIFVLLS